jgi:FkbM family methyltransferase
VKQRKSLLRRLLGEEKYLCLISRLFFIAYNRGSLKDKPMYHMHYFVPNLIGKGQTVIDIGANLGYYSCIFSKTVGSYGKVIAVEPIELYRRVLKNNTATLENITVLPYALGEKEGTILMGNPGPEAHRHGLMHVLSAAEQQQGGPMYEVTMKHPVELLNHLDVIHYIKVDVEGYEIPVVPLMEPLLRRHMPLLQIEVTPTTLEPIFLLLRRLDYRMFWVSEAGMHPISEPNCTIQGDLLAIPGARLHTYLHLVA